MTLLFIDSESQAQNVSFPENLRLKKVKVKNRVGDTNNKTHRYPNSIMTKTVNEYVHVYQKAKNSTQRQTIRDMWKKRIGTVSDLGFKPGLVSPNLTLIPSSL